MIRPTHSPDIIRRYTITDNELLIGGYPVTLLAERAGQTPFYAYDRSVITDRIKHLRSHLPEQIHIHYAIKANPMPAVVQHLSSMVDGFDLASGGEMRIALDTMMSPDNISFAGPGKSLSEISSAIATGVTLNIESQNELVRIIEQGNRLNISPKVALRINPDFELKSSGMKMGGGPKPFGIDIEQAQDILEQIFTSNIDFQGFHIFSGSQNLSAESIMEAQTKTFELAQRLSGLTTGPIKKLNIGGGFGIPYFPGEATLDLTPIGENLSSLLKQNRDWIQESKVIVELGRYIVGEAGVYICKIRDKKISRDQIFIITDGGLHQHLAASGNFGQVIRKNYPVIIATRVNSERKEMATIAGPLCTPLDVLADKMELSSAEIGDLVAVFQSGAYGYSASPRSFLSHPEPVELLV